MAIIDQLAQWEHFGFPVRPLGSLDARVADSDHFVPAVFLCLQALRSCSAHAAAPNWLPRLQGAVIIVILLTVIGFAEYVLGIFSFSGARYFPSEFENTRSSWYFVSVLFQTKLHGPWGAILVTLGLIGLVQAAIFAERRVRWFARAMLGFAVLIIGFGTATVLIDFWRGPSPIYFEGMLWPVYVLFSIRLLFSGFSVFRARVMQRSHEPTMTHESGPTTLALLAAVPVAIVLTSYPVGRADVARPFAYPQSQPELVKILMDNIALKPGKPIQGRVATFQLQAQEQPASWADIHNADAQRMMQSGNDFHLIGLWSHGIPTLSEYAPTISPELYLSATRLLARPEDQQNRSALVLRRIDANVLAAFGVRYVITDELKAPPLRLVLIETENLSNPVYLYEVPNAIRGVASPRKFRRAATFSSALEALPDLSDPKDTAIIMDADVGDIEFSTLSVATDPTITPVAGGFEISASSQGKSLLVVPMLFSHCLSFYPDDSSYPDVSGAGDGTLMRVNAIQTGILFEGQLKGELRYFTGPFDGPRCRLKDAADFFRFVWLRWASNRMSRYRHTRPSGDCDGSVRRISYQRPLRMTHLMWKVCPLARRIVRRDHNSDVSLSSFHWQIGYIRFALHRANDATTSKGQRFHTRSRLCLNFGRRCDHLMVLGTTSMPAPRRRSGKTGQMSHS